MSDNNHNQASRNADALLQKAYSLKNNAESRELYAQWATTYDHTMLEELGYLTPCKTAALLGKHVLPKRAKILDVGSGTGLAGIDLAKLKFSNLDALDYSPEMLAVAESRGVYINLIEADLNEPLKISNNIYDALICTGTFTHAHVGANCLDELFRILKPGGIFACTVHKDIWHSQGFENKLNMLTEAGVIKTLHRQLGEYYKSSTEPEGWYIVWQKV